MIGLGTPMVLLAEQLGASTFQVGLASSFVFLLLPFQVVSTTFLRRLGYKRQMLIGWSVRALFLLVPFGIAWTAPDAKAAGLVNLLVASIFCFCLFRAFGVAAHLPWYYSIIPAEVRGRFFATDHAIVSIVGVVTLLFCAALFARRSSWDAFVVVYGVALIGSALAVLNLTRLPDAARPNPSPLGALHREARRLCLTPGPFRFYLGLALAAATIAAALGPFTVYYLKVETQLSSSRILGFTAAQFAGSIAGTWAIRAWIDRMQIRRLYQLCVLLAAVVHGFWFSLVTGAGLTAWLALAFFVHGLSVGISNVAHFTYMASLGDEDERPMVVAVFTAAHGLFAGLAPMLWGLLLRESGGGSRIDVEAFAAFFVVALLLDAVLIPLYGRLGLPPRQPGT